MPVFPRPPARVARLEYEPAIRSERPTDGAQRRPQLIVLDEALERVPHHHREVELAGEPKGGRGSGKPLDLAPALRAGEHRRIGIDTAQPPGMSRLTGAVEQLSRTAADVEYCACVHHQWEIEGAVRTPRIEDFVQRRSFR